MRKTKTKGRPDSGPATGAPGASADKAADSGGRRRLGFRLAAAVGIPLLLLLSAEGLLRLAGYGYSTHFFRPTQLAGRKVWMDNQDFGRRFFPPGLVRRPEPITLAADKPPGTLRVFVLGESAAMGDPDFKFGLPRMLEVLLRERFPNRHIEVVNAAMVAINSHVIRPIAADCAARQPDLWVIYMGNNEIIGPFGSASPFGAQAPALPLVRAGLWAKTTRLGQLLDAGLYLARRGSAPLPEWAGMEMMADQKVRWDSPASQRVYRHFEGNLGEILASSLQSGVPILLCTVATNLKDCPPFASQHRPGLAAAELTDWQAAYDAGVALQNRGQAAEAKTAYDRAAHVDDTFAELTFRRAQCASLLGQTNEAASGFRQARDQDALQFRADSRINGAIRQAAATLASRGVTLVDADQLFANQSPDGVPGAQYFYEHVHLTPEGNYLLAKALAEQAARVVGLETTGAWLSQSDCWRRLGLTWWSRYRALEVILDRVQQAPFTAQAGHDREVERVKEEMTRYLPATKPASVRQDARQVAPLVARWPEDPYLRWNLAALLEGAGDAAGAEEQWRALIALEPQAALPVFNLGRLLDSLGRPTEAIPLYRESLRLQSDYMPARLALGLLCLKQDQPAEAARHLEMVVRQKPGAIDIRVALGEALARGGNPAQAEQQFREVLRREPNNSQAQEALHRLGLSGQ